LAAGLCAPPDSSLASRGGSLGKGKEGRDRKEGRRYTPIFEMWLLRTTVIK